MYRFYLILTLLCCNLSHSQLKVSHISNSNEIMTVLLGDSEDITVSNISITGDKRAFGTFNVNLLYNTFINEGVIISTGLAKNAEGPNDDSKKSSKINFLSDKDINKITEYKGCYDTALFEFDLVSATDKIEFRYCFASEEYPEYILKNVNDAFIFLVKNIETSTSENIAILNGDKNIPITVDHINPKINSEYYVENVSYNLQNIEVLKTDLAKLERAKTFQYDGFTTTLVAQVKVVPNKVYHFKLGISDVGDQLYDSAIFLEANSLKSTGERPKLEDHLERLVSEISLDFSIQFETASTRIKGDNSFLLLNKIVAALKNKPDIYIKIIGHTDKVGTDKYNNKLSLGRAKSVSDYLIKTGISENRISTNGMGESQPKSEIDIENRRVEIVFSK